jgi:membrane-associated protease RseP (regulator of RpoE activity)
MNWELIIAVVFYGLLGLLIYKNRSKFEWMEKILLVHRTQWGIRWMQKIAMLEPLWKIWSTLGIPVAVYFALKIIILLANNALTIAAGTGGAGVALAIPGVKIPGSPIFIPFWYGIISIAVLATVHEMAHGIVAAMEGVRLKSTGLGFLAVIPLAFVELDEDQMRDMPPLVRMRISAAGAFANVSVYFVIMFILGLFITPFLSSLMQFQGIEVTSIVGGKPADLAGIEEGAIITSVNGNETLNLYSFVTTMGHVKPGDTVTLGTLNQSYTVNMVADPNNNSRAYMGVFLEQVSEPTAEANARFGFLLSVMIWIYGLFLWIANLNLMIGVLNFLPIWILDGGRIFADLLGYVIKKREALVFVINLLFAFVTALLLFNLVGPLFKNFFYLI